MTRKRLGILISGRGSNMEALLEAALDPAWPCEPVLVLSNRPDAGGLDLLGKFREHDELKDTPIIVVTARAERDDIVAALAYGATGYLNKPIKAEALLRHVKDALGIP